MSIITKLVLKYLRLNPKRTMVAVISIILSVILLMAASNVFVWGFEYMKKVEETTYGSWHAKYHDLTLEQAERLKLQDEFASCELIETDTGWQADVELKMISDELFQTTQEIGSRIGMTKLSELGIEDLRPDGQAAEHDISYHMDLLDFYGLQYYNQQEVSMQKLLWMLIAIIMGITALLIYSIFSLSFMEKQKYVGLLDCIGASRIQRILFVFEEGIILGLLSVPIGILTGMIASKYVIEIVGRYLRDVWNLGIEVPFTLDYRLVFLITGLGMCTVFFAILIPTVQVLKVNSMQLIYNAGETKPETSKIRYYEKITVECNMAVRNLLCNKKKAVKLFVFAALSIVVAFNGYIKIQSMRGKYLLEDKREEYPLDAWVSIYSDEFTKGTNITKELENSPWCEEASYHSVLDMDAVVIEDKYIADDLKQFILMWWGGENPMYFFRDAEEEKYYGFAMKVIGVEDEVFQKYSEEIGFSGQLDLSKYPVILDDYIPVKNKGEDYASFREVFVIPEGEEISLQFGKYGDYFISQESLIYSEHEKVDVQVLGVTKERAPIPLMPDAYGMSRDDLTQMPSYYVKVYMPYSAFQKFLEDEHVKHTYGKDKESNHPVMTENENPIQHYVTFERVDNVSEKEISDDLDILMKNEELRPYMSSYEESYINDSNSWRYSNIENLKRDELLRNVAEILRRAFIIGGIILVLFFALFSLSNYILTSIYMRKRELAVFQSLGMGYQGLKKMLLYENAILILIATIVGSVLALVILQDQFEKIKMGAATVEMHFPIVTYSSVIIGILMVTSIVSIVAVRKVKHINVIETLRR